MAGPKPGLANNSILFCWLFTIKDLCKKVRFQQTHNQGFRQLLFMVSWNLPSMAHLTVFLYLCSSRSNARGEGPWRALCRLNQNALLKRSKREWGSCWEEQKRIALPRHSVINLPSRQIKDFSQKDTKEKLSYSGQTWRKACCYNVPLCQKPMLTPLVCSLPLGCCSSSSCIRVS